MSIRPFRLIALFLATLGLSSCVTGEDWQENYRLQFLPRECIQIITLPMQYTETPEISLGREMMIKSVEPLKDGSVEAGQLVLWLMTGEDDLKELRNERPNIKDRRYEYMYELYYLSKERKLTTPRNPSLERQLESDYRAYSKARLRSSGGGRYATAVHPWEYRVTGVKDFRIVSLSPLFGKPAETSLNDFFSIYEFKPRQVISYRTKQLLWGYQDKKELKNIAQWLSLEPMAPPVVMFRLNTRPEELPIKTKLVTILETTDGKTLRDTLEVQLK